MKAPACSASETGLGKILWEGARSQEYLSFDSFPSVHTDSHPCQAHLSEGLTYSLEEVKGHLEMRRGENGQETPWFKFKL